MKTKAKNKDLRQHLDIVSRVRIDHRAYKEIYDELVGAYDSIGFTATPVCLLITGDTRTGKSSVVRELLETYVPSQASDTPVRNVVYAVAPAKATLKSLVEALLKGLGDPFWSRGTETSMTQRLYTMLDAVQCKMIILDEFQHLCDKGQDKKLDVLADWLKVLVEGKAYGLVAVGLPLAASVVNGHRQLVGRFDNELRMPRFDWGDTMSVRQFRGILQQFEHELHPFKMPALGHPDMALRMYLATAGRIGLVAKLLDRVVRNAIRAGRLELRVDDFADAYDRAIWCAQLFPVAGGPFRAKSQLLADESVHAAVLSNAAMEHVADESAAVSVHGQDTPADAAPPKPKRNAARSARSQASGRRRGVSSRKALERELGRAL